MTEVDTTGMEKAVIKYIQSYMDNHKAYNSFVLVETMLFYDKDSTDYLDQRYASSVFDIMPAVDYLFGQGEFGVFTHSNYPSSYISFEDGKKVVFIKSISDGMFNINQMKEIYEKYAYHVDNSDGKYEIYDKEHQFFMLNRRSGKVEIIDEHEFYKLKTDFQDRLKVRITLHDPD